MGEVYRARDTRLNRTVALKIVNAVWSDRDEGRRRFEREARLASQVNHPNVCAVYDVGRADSGEFIIMEFVEGETLAERLRRGPIAPGDVIRLGQAMAEGLDAAHRLDMVHRDFKPGNVMLSRNGVKILDFGLARALADESADHADTRTIGATAPGMVLGTLPYMAPEQLLGRRVDARTDVFALAGLSLECVGTERSLHSAIRPIRRSPQGVARRRVRATLAPGQSRDLLSGY